MLDLQQKLTSNAILGKIHLLEDGGSLKMWQHFWSPFSSLFRCEAFTVATSAL